MNLAPSVGKRSAALRAENITRLLHEACDGNLGSTDKLISAVYSDLRKVAGRYMASERPDHTLQPTAIVNEVFLRLFRPVGSGGWRPAPIAWQSRAHFLGVAARQMRQVLIDHSRQKNASKRLGIKISLDGADFISASPEQDFETIDQLLDLLATKDPAAARVVELKFFGGLADREAALVIGSSVAKLRRDWEFARSWLRHRIAAGNSAAGKRRLVQ